MVALVAADPPSCLCKRRPPVGVLGVQPFDDVVVLCLGASLCQSRLGAAPGAKPSEVEECKHHCAAHGREEAACAVVGVEARDVQDLRVGGRELEGVHGDDSVEGERAWEEGVLESAWEVCVGLARLAGLGHVVEDALVLPGERVGRDGAEDSGHAGVAKLSMCQAELRPVLVRGDRRGRGRWWEREVAALHRSVDCRRRLLDVDARALGVHNHAQPLMRLEADKEGHCVVA